MIINGKSLHEYIEEQKKKGDFVEFMGGSTVTNTFNGGNRVTIIDNGGSEMSDKNDSATGCTCGCGCLLLLISVILLCFVFTVVVRSCERESLWEGAVQTTKEYVETADSIWNN